ncbi:MAG: phosphate acyltransferase PlsX [Clostridiales bacterium]|mgnify:CR=1 FL=1|nr:phosphate acyltransferase PlsX [Clostridiales bacterium]
MNIVIDGMGGDNAPSAIVEGCIDAVREYGVNIILVGDKSAIENELSKYEYDISKIQIVHTTEVITNDEDPAMAPRRKKDSSLSVGMKLVKEGKGDAFISAGSTGAILSGAIMYIKRIKGVKRPALAPIFPGKNGSYMILDIGANVDCKPEYLMQFAIMGAIYFEKVLKFKNPKVGLINNGVEEEKGNELTKAVYQLLKKSDLNFIGNVEPRDIPNGDVQVLVCDGFVGNAILKFFEGTAFFIFDSLKTELMSNTVSKFAALLLKPSFKRLKKRFDFTERGGAAFLGVDGAVIKAHGSSNAKAIKNAIGQAKLFVENDVTAQIKASIKTDDDTGLDTQI